MLEVEMQRTVVSLSAEAERWRDRAAGEAAGNEWVEGRRAYGFQQAAIQEGLVAKFKRLWAQPDKPRQVLGKRSGGGDKGEGEDEDGDEEEQELIPEGSEEEED
ncbi:hypothetical protein V5O48_006987 [Marasmius crinis-equi]|uniref:Uncharacterized protein n=1 Tax=Marasmius crinis-equi TaxID=585013 RepID=A0ABR3FHY7_9AGAR